MDVSLELVFLWGGSCFEVGFLWWACIMIMFFERKCENAVSVDRIDSTMGYQPDNIHLTCWWVNRMKFDLELSDFKNKVKVLAESFVA